MDRAIWEVAVGPERPDVATCLNNLALLYSNQGQYPRVEPLYQRALAIREKASERRAPQRGDMPGDYAPCLRAMDRSKEADKRILARKQNWERS